MNLRTQFNDLNELMLYFSDDLTCTKYLELLRWNGKPNCPHCLSTNTYSFKDQKQYKCKDCSRKYTVTIGTIFEGTKISLRKWFIAIYQSTSVEDCVSPTKLARQLDITPKSASYLLERIRFALQTNAAKSTVTKSVMKNTKNQEISTSINRQMGRYDKSRALKQTDQAEMKSIV
jgi:transposase-like protein